MTIERSGTITPKTIKVSPANYARNMQAIEDIVTKGREYVISKTSLDEVSYPMPKRGDRLKDPEIGTQTIAQVIEMYDLGGVIMGYRVRTE